MSPTRIRLEQILFLLAGSLLGRALWSVGGPMPFLFGGIVTTAGLVAWFEHREGIAERRLPNPLRMGFVALTGAMIGTTFSPTLLAVIPEFWLTAIAVLLFIAVAHLGSYVIMRRIGRFSPVDALYASMPGGLVEATLLGEKAGADPKALAIQHFIRVLLVVMIVPTLFLIVTGQAVGSASGQGISPQASGLTDIAVLAVVAALGTVLGKGLRVPAGHLMGPLAVSALACGSGWVVVAVSPWLLNLAQLVIGVALGAQISGLTGAMLVRGLKAGLASVGYMLCVTFVFALVLTPVSPTTVDVLFLAYAPAGVTEMSLIAMSLQISPVIVALHHMIRIVCTVLMTQVVAGILKDWFRV